MTLGMALGSPGSSGEVGGGSAPWGRERSLCMLCSAFVCVPVPTHVSTGVCCEILVQTDVSTFGFEDVTGQGNHKRENFQGTEAIG